jgi:hypothetical protein
LLCNLPSTPSDFSHFLIRLPPAASADLSDWLCDLSAESADLAHGLCDLSSQAPYLTYGLCDLASAKSSDLADWLCNLAATRRRHCPGYGSARRSGHDSQYCANHQ